MAITLGTGSGVNNNKTSASGISLNPSNNNIVAGQIAIVAVAKDNSSTTDGDNAEVTSVTDALGNTYTKLKEFTNGQGAAAGGATISVWKSKLVTGYTTTDAITANFASAVTAKAIIINSYNVTSGADLQVAGTSQTLANDGADPGSMTVGSLPSKEYLFYRATAYEAAPVVPTATASWTDDTNALGTSGGGAASNMSLAVEHRILTGTTATSDPTVTAVDCASVMVALEELIPVGAIMPVNTTKPFQHMIVR